MQKLCNSKVLIYSFGGFGGQDDSSWTNRYSNAHYIVDTGTHTKYQIKD